VKLLRKILEGLEEGVDELETQLTKQSVDVKQPGKTDEVPLLFDEAASDVLELLRGTLAEWSGENAGGVGKLGECRRHLAWLITHVVDLRSEPDIDRMFRKLIYVRSRIYSVIDRRQEKVALGRCACGLDVWSFPDREVWVCKCGERFNVQTTRERFRNIGREQKVTAKQAEALGEVYGRVIRARTVHQWHRRRHLSDHGKNEEGLWVFRFGDLLELAGEGVVQQLEVNDT
jgi:hypothetical protein